MRTRESTTTLRGCERLCVSWAGPRGVGFVDLSVEIYSEIVRMLGTHSIACSNGKDRRQSE
jgi:hypothetical protein